MSSFPVIRAVQADQCSLATNRRASNIYIINSQYYFSHNRSSLGGVSKDADLKQGILISEIDESLGQDLGRKGGVFSIACNWKSRMTAV